MQIFDRGDPDLAASLSHNFSMARVKPELREKVEAEYSKEQSSITGAHIDGPPFVALLMNDRPGLQVIGAEGRWIDAPVTCRTAPGDYSVPVIPGSVIVNTGGTLMHLSRGRCVCALA
jgi:isopenicillin N synthase-like dioxygenase